MFFYSDMTSLGWSCANSHRGASFRRQPKAQSPKPKAQSPKPKAQSPKPKAVSHLLQIRGSDDQFVVPPPAIWIDSQWAVMETRADLRIPDETATALFMRRRVGAGLRSVIAPSGGHVPRRDISVHS